MNLHFAQRGAQSADRALLRMHRTGKTPKGTALWSEDEVRLLRLHYPDYDQLCDILPRRTLKAIRSKCEKLNIARKLKFWTAREISALRRFWCGGSLKAELAEMFPECSWKSICRAAESRGFKRPRQRYPRVKNEKMNKIRDRCFELGYTLTDLDALANTKKYFQHFSSNAPRPDIKRMDRAIEALGGKLEVVWKD